MIDIYRDLCHIVDRQQNGWYVGNGVLLIWFANHLIAR